MRKNNINISSDWAEKLAQEFTKPYFVRLISYISEEEENFNVYPEKEIRFEAINSIVPSSRFKIVLEDKNKSIVIQDYLYAVDINAEDGSIIE